MEAHAQVVPVVAQPRPEPAYALDTGDKLRIVVFGQEGLSNSYFVDAAGQVTMPLIGAVTARGLTTQQLARAIGVEAACRLHPRAACRDRGRDLSAVLHSRRGDAAGPVSLRAEHDGGDRGGDRRRLHAARLSLRRQDRPADHRRDDAQPQLGVPLLTRVQPGDTIVIKERWF